MNGFISSPFPPTSARALYQGTTLVVPHISSQRWALAPVPISSTFCSLGEWNERVDIEPLPTHERSCFVSGHDFSRAAHQPSTMGFSPCSYLEHILFIRSVPGFPTSPLSPAPLMWFSLKRTTCSWPKPQVSTGNLGEPRDLRCAPPLPPSSRFALYP